MFEISDSSDFEKLGDIDKWVLLGELSHYTVASELDSGCRQGESHAVLIGMFWRRGPCAAST
jgi:hypothetical protein